MSVSLMTIEPCSGLSSPTRDFRKTDLPVPEGPRRTEISPGGSVSVTSLQMFWLPNDFVSPSTSTASPTCVPLRLRLPGRSPPRRNDEPRQCATPLRRPHPDGGGSHHYWSVTTGPPTGYGCPGVSVTWISR